MFICVTRVSNQLNLLMTNSTPLLFSTMKVSMVTSLSSSIIFYDNCTLILIFFKYQALRMANYLCFDFYKCVLLNYDIIISNILSYICLQPTSQWIFYSFSSSMHHSGDINIRKGKGSMEENDLQAEEEDKAFIQIQPSHTINKDRKIGTAFKKKKTKQRIKKNTLRLIDKLLVISCIVLGVCALIGNWFVNLHQKRIIKQRMQRNKKEEIETNNFFNMYNKIVQNKQNEWFNIQYLSEDEVINSVQYLSQQKCSQYQPTPMEFQIKQQQQQQLLHQQQQQQDEHENGNEQIGQQKQIEQRLQKQIQNVQKINQQQRVMQKKQKQFHTISGITKQKLSQAQKYKTLIKIPPWQHNSLCQQQYLYYDSIYRIGSYDTQLPFCIVVPTFNNQPEQRYKNNINSIIQQNYTNYHVVIIDDASTDGTGTLLEQYSLYLKQSWSKRNKSITIDIYHNEKQMKAMPNLRKAAMDYCLPQQIYVVVDGDDYLLGRQVLKLFNSQFQQHGSWFVYSNFISFTGTIGYSRKHKQQVIEQNRYRKANFATSHLRAFYTSLFQLVKEEDLKDDNGEYFRAANDVAICIPILQMSHRRLHYIPQITYLYNSNTGLNNHIVRIRQQIDNSKIIRKRRKYQALQQLPK